MQRITSSRDEFRWHVWFAWFPVTVRLWQADTVWYRHTVWWEPVLRVRRSSYGDCWWDYASIDRKYELLGERGKDTE